MASNQPAYHAAYVSIFHSHTAAPDDMRDLVSMTATTVTRTGLRSASGLSLEAKLGSEQSSVNVLSAIPDHAAIR